VQETAVYGRIAMAENTLLPDEHNTQSKSSDY
jgi:hypothetical protein